MALGTLIRNFHLAGSLDGSDGAQLCCKTEEEETKHCWSKISPSAELSTDERGAKNHGWDKGRARQ